MQREGFANHVIHKIFTNQRNLILSFDEVMQSELKYPLPSFQEFVSYLCNHNDETLDEHWRSQCSCLVFDSYDIYLQIEILEKMWNNSPLHGINLITSAPHSTRTGKTIATNHDDLNFQRNIAITSGSEIRKTADTHNIIPDYSFFFTIPDLFYKFTIRYADDIIMYTGLFPEAKESDPLIAEAFKIIFKSDNKG